MDINAAFPSKYLKAADLQSKHVGVVIDGIQMEDLGDDSKPVLYFKGKQKSG